MRTIDRVKKKFIEEGFESSLERRISNRVYEKKTDGDVEAKLVTLCCSEPPQLKANITLYKLIEKAMALSPLTHIAAKNHSNVKKPFVLVKRYNFQVCHNFLYIENQRMVFSKCVVVPPYYIF